MNQVGEKSSKLTQSTPESLFSGPKDGFPVSKPVSKAARKLTQPDTWLRHIPELWDLAWTLFCCAHIYALPWAPFWSERWGDWPWVKRAMEQTYHRLDPEDRAVVEQAYEQFAQNIEHYDEIALCKSQIQQGGNRT